MPSDPATLSRAILTEFSASGCASAACMFSDDLEMKAIRDRFAPADAADPGDRGGRRLAPRLRESRLRGAGRSRRSARAPNAGASPRAWRRRRRGPTPCAATISAGCAALRLSPDSRARVREPPQSGEAGSRSGRPRRAPRVGRRVRATGRFRCPRSVFGRNAHRARRLGHRSHPWVAIPAPARQPTELASAALAPPTLHGERTDEPAQRLPVGRPRDAALGDDRGDQTRAGSRRRRG